MLIASCCPVLSAGSAIVSYQRPSNGRQGSRIFLSKNSQNASCAALLVQIQSCLLSQLWCMAEEVQALPKRSVRDGDTATGL